MPQWANTQGSTPQDLTGSLKQNQRGLPSTQTRETTNIRRQRNVAQMKEQKRPPEKELSKVEITNLSDMLIEFKTLAIRMLKDLSTAKV